MRYQPRFLFFVVIPKGQQFHKNVVHSFYKWGCCLEVLSPDGGVRL